MGKESQWVLWSPLPWIPTRFAHCEQVSTKPSHGLGAHNERSEWESRAEVTKPPTGCVFPLFKPLDSSSRPSD